MDTLPHDILNYILGYFNCTKDIARLSKTHKYNNHTIQNIFHFNPYKGLYLPLFNIGHEIHLLFHNNIKPKWKKSCLHATIINIKNNNLVLFLNHYYAIKLLKENNHIKNIVQFNKCNNKKVIIIKNYKRYLLNLIHTPKMCSHFYNVRNNQKWIC